MSCYLKSEILMCQRTFFRKLSQIKEYVENLRDDMENFFHFACQKRVKNCM